MLRFFFWALSEMFVKSLQNSRDSRANPWYISRLILRSENRSPTDTSDSTKRYKQRTGQCSFPLSPDIVRLVGQRGWNVGVRAGGD